MSSLYIYGLCLAPVDPLSLPLGLEGNTYLVTEGAIAALVEANLNLEEIQSDNSRLLAAVLNHDRVLCDLFQQITVLPLRFGTQLASLDQLTTHLVAEQTRYHQRLQALAGKAEYQIKLLPLAIAPPPPAEGLKGREYFLAKKQRLQDLSTAQQQQQDECQTLLDQLSAAYPQAVIPAATETEAKVYLLLAPQQVEPLEQQLENWRSQMPHWQIILSQALPPYHFV